MALAVYPAVSDATNRRRFLQDDETASEELETIDGRAFVPSRNILRSEELVPIDVEEGENEFLAAATILVAGPPEKRMSLKLVAGKPGAGFGQVVDSVRITIRRVEDSWTLASSRTQIDVEYEYPLDDGAVTLDVYRSPADGGGISGKDPALDSGKRKFVVMVHGMWTAPDAMQDTYNNVFKRLFWLGFRGNFVGFDWDSDELAFDLLAANSENALRTAPSFLRFLNDSVLTRWEARPQDVDVMSFSLGNLVTVDALRIGADDKRQSQGPAKLVHNVIQLFAGTWADAYEPRGDLAYTGLPGHAKTYTVEELERHSWHHWFRQKDRPIKGDGGLLTGKMYHAYNGLDGVLINGTFLDFLRNGCLAPELPFSEGRVCLPSFPNPRFHYNRDNLVPTFVDAPVFRAPLQGFHDGKYLLSLGSLPTLLPLRDQRRPDYSLPEVGYFSGLAALDFADSNYDTNASIPSGILGHGDFIWKPFSQVYWLYQDLFVGRAVGGPSIPIGREK